MKIEMQKAYRDQSGARVIIHCLGVGYVGGEIRGYAKGTRNPPRGPKASFIYTEDGQCQVTGHPEYDLVGEWEAEADWKSVLRHGPIEGRDMISEAVQQVAAAEGYEPLAGILQEAHDQAASGKGRERHARNRPFMDQPILEIGRMCGPGFNMGQSIKKQQEAMGMLARGDHGAAIRELLGAINYAASAILLIREQNPAA